MEIRQLLARQAEYNAWINARLYEVCAEISDDVRKKDMGAFFKSIHGTLNHNLLGIVFGWVDFVTCRLK